jgi:hypothetical protein
MRKLRSNGLLGIVGLFLLLLSGCGGDDHRVIITGPGLVGIDDAITAPELRVAYTIPPGTRITALIFSDQPSDGDIEFDRIRGSFIITQGPSTLLFGIDSAAGNRPEFRAFLDFPLDGSTGEDAIPLDAVIVSATLTIFVDFVDFAARVPVLLDLVEYSVVLGLAPADFDSFPLGGLAFDLFAVDAGNDVQIDVTGLMRQAQQLALNDFQVRFLLGP